MGGSGSKCSQPRNKKEVNELIDQVNNAKNSMMRKHGYAPFQRVFGCDLRFPQGILESDPNIAYQSGVFMVMRIWFDPMKLQ